MRLAFHIFLLQCTILCMHYYSTTALRGKVVRPAKDKEFPFIVSINYKKSSSRHTTGSGIEHFCTGCLISPTHVLTARHCFEREREVTVNGKKDIEYYLEDVSDVQVTVGSNQLKGGTKIGAKSVVAFEEWAEKNLKRLEKPLDPRFNDYDLAILTLEKPVSSSIKPAGISYSNLNNVKHDKKNPENPNDRIVKLAGWGYSTNGEISETMTTAEINLISDNACTKAARDWPNYNRYIANSKYLCTMANPEVLLQDADSGGPVLNKDNLVIGVNGGTFPREEDERERLSASQVAKLPQINMHANLDYYKQFIEETIGHH